MPTDDLQPLRPNGIRRARSLTTLTLSGLGLLLAAGCTSGETTTAHHSDTHAPGVTALDLDVDDSGASQVGWTTAAINITVTATDRDRVAVNRQFEHTEDDEPTESFDRDGGTLTATIECPSHFAVGRPTCTADYEIEVPRGTSVRATTMNGDVSVSGTGAGTDLRSDDGNLDVVVPDDGSRYAVDAATGDGKRTVDVPEATKGTEVTLRSRDGDVSVTEEPR